MRPRLFAHWWVLPAALLACAPLPALAQPEGAGKAGSDTSSMADESTSAKPSGKAASRPGVHVSPYIEAAQIVTADISPGNEVLTYTRLAAGVDAEVAGRNNAASVSLRYERYIGWSKDASDGDTISGIARGYTTIAPGLQIEGGAMAARSKVGGDGALNFGGLGIGGDSARVYSVYAGPTLTKMVGDVRLDAGYHFGYTRVEEPDSDDGVVTPGFVPVDVFDESTVHNATIHAGIRPGVVAPVGIGAGAGYYREEVSNLDQRLEDFNARLDFTLPVSLDLALLAGVGYEKVEISARDALRDGNGIPLVGSDGRFVTDDSSPRQIAYETDGLIWDVGVLWRPSRRTSLEAHVGKRYGSTTYYGSFAYAPNTRSSLNVSVYDNVAGFGGQVNRAIIGLPVQFDATRDPLTGDLIGCVASQQQGNTCVVDVLGSVRSSVFRARGVMASYNLTLGRISAGLGAGYDRRKFFGARGTILEASSGVIDRNLWVTAFASSKVGDRGSLAGNVYANWFESGGALGGKSSALGATLAYGHTLTDHLAATAALGLDGIMHEESIDDLWTASALVGVKYRF